MQNKQGEILQSLSRTKHIKTVKCVWIKSGSHCLKGCREETDNNICSGPWDALSLSSHSQKSWLEASNNQNNTITDVGSTAPSNSRLGVSRPIYVNVDSPNLCRFSILKLFRGVPVKKKHPVILKWLPNLESTIKSSLLINFRFV